MPNLIKFGTVGHCLKLCVNLAEVDCFACGLELSAFQARQPRPCPIMLAQRHAATTWTNEGWTTPAILESLFLSHTAVCQDFFFADARALAAGAEMGCGIASFV